MTKSMNAGAQRHAPGTIWHKSGEPMRAAPQSPSARPDLSLVATPFAELHDAPRTLTGRLLCGVQGWADRLIASLSSVSTAPVLDVREFDWTAHLRGAWTRVRDEALAMVGDRHETMVWHQGAALPAALAPCPETLGLLRRIPALESAAFVVLPGGTHRPARRGPTKAIITCDLALAVPRNGDVRMRVHDRIVRWAEGETLMFDDSFVHESWNEASHARIILRVRVARPLRRPGPWLRQVILHGLRQKNSA